MDEADKSKTADGFLERQEIAYTEKQDDFTPKTVTIGKAKLPEPSFIDELDEAFGEISNIQKLFRESQEKIRLLEESRKRYAEIADKLAEQSLIMKQCFSEIEGLVSQLDPFRTQHNTVRKTVSKKTGRMETREAIENIKKHLLAGGRINRQGVKLFGVKSGSTNYTLKKLLQDKRFTRSHTGTRAGFEYYAK